jgi:ParB-like chromosome segregation protein Spo0J
VVKEFVYLSVGELFLSSSVDQVRVSDGRLAVLADSIRVNGLLQPLVVSVRSEGGFVVVAGARRFLAGQKAGLVSFPCVVVDAGSELGLVELGLLENLQRVGLNEFDEIVGVLDLLRHVVGFESNEVALSFLRRMERGTVLEVDGERSNRVVQVFAELNLSWVGFTARASRLLGLPEDVRLALQVGDIDGLAAARIVARVKDEGERARLIAAVSEQGLGKRDIERRVAALQVVAGGSGNSVLEGKLREFLGGLRGLKPEQLEALGDRLDGVVSQLVALVGSGSVGGSGAR